VLILYKKTTFKEKLGLIYAANPSQVLFKAGTGKTKSSKKKIIFLIMKV